MVNVNGPLNLVRLEGKIDNQKKIIYLFLDIHLPHVKQRECPEARNIDIHQFLLQKFSDTKIKYDFFLEIFPTDLFSTKHYPLKNIYIAQTAKLFRQHLKYNPMEDKVMVSKELPNVRFHYIDPRVYFEDGAFSFQKWGETINYIKYDQTKPIIKLAKDAIEELKQWQKLLVNRCSEPKKKPTRPVIQKSEKLPTGSQAVELRDYIINKIFCQYNKKHLQETISTIANEEVIPLLSTTIQKMEKLVEICKIYADLLDMPNDQLLPQDRGLLNYNYGVDQFVIDKTAIMVKQQYYDADNYLVHFLAKIMDLYFLRRILDKNFINHGIVYTGAAHSLFYIRALTKYFKFQITHVDDIDISIKEANEKATTLPYEDLSEIFFPSQLKQCIRTRHFPELFT